jgi:hypothetical protein
VKKVIITPAAAVTVTLPPTAPRGWRTRSMRKIAAGSATAMLTIGILPIPAAPVVTASPCSVGGPACAICVRLNRFNPEVCALGPVAAPPRPAPPLNRVPVNIPQAPPRPAAPAPVQIPEFKPPPPAPVPVVMPKINPPGPAAPRNASVVTPPKKLEAPPAAIDAAKAAPATHINPANPPPSPTHVDFKQQIENVTKTHTNDVDVVKVDNQALARPRGWDFVGYDMYHRPTLYNPLTEAMTFRYFDDGAYRDVYVPAGGQVLLDIATAGVFPFTAVGDNYLASGSFNGGGWIPPDGWDGPPPPDYTPPAPPDVYQNVLADVPAANQTVQVGQVVVVGHDDSRPAGSQDTFLLDDNTLAWGKINGPDSGAQITVTKTQSLPGVGPTDNGSYLVALAAHEQPADNWWPWALGGGGVLAITAVLGAWLVRRRKRDAELAAATVVLTQQGPL